MQLMQLKKVITAILASSAVMVLFAAPIAIPAIMVKASHKNTTYHAKAVGNSLHISKQEIDQQGNTLVTDFLGQQGVLQLANHSSQQGQQSIAMHGFGTNASQNNLLLINGIPYNSFTTIGPDLNGILVAGIQQLVVLPGSYGSLYGDGAIGGVVNVLTGISNKTQADLTFGFGNLLQRYTSLYFSRHPSQALAYSIGGSFYQNAHTQPNNKQKSYNLNAAFQYDAQNDRFDAFFLGFKNQLQIPEGLIWGQPISYAPNHNFSNVVGQLAYLKNQWFITPQLNWTSSVSTQNSRANGEINGAYHSKQHDVLWQNKLFYHQFFISGFDLEGQQYHEQNRVEYDKVSALVGDLYSQLTLPLGKRLHFILGGRYAHQSVNAIPGTVSTIDSHSHVFVNEQGLKLKLSSHWQYFIRRDTNYRFAKANEKVWTVDNARNLKTQTGVSYETGVRWENMKNHFSLALYRLDLNNEIAYNPTPTSTSPFGRMFNLPPTRRLGVDLINRYFIMKPLSVNFQAAYVDAYFSSGQFEGNTIPEVSALNSHLGMTYQGHSDWYVTLSESYHSSFYPFEDLDNIGPKMPGYFLTNLNMHKQWKVFGVGLQVNNLFDKHYVRFANFFSFPTQMVEYFPGDGISFLLKVTIRLN